MAAVRQLGAVTVIDIVVPFDAGTTQGLEVGMTPASRVGSMNSGEGYKMAWLLLKCKQVMKNYFGHVLKRKKYNSVLKTMRGRRISTGILGPPRSFDRLACTPIPAK